MSRFPRRAALSAAPLLSILSGASAALAADLRLPDLFADGMVLQQEDSVPIWGYTDPGTVVAVKGGWMPEWVRAETATADETGRFELALGTPKADGKPTTLRIDAGGDSLVLKNVLLGEVWLCSGQSNMEWKLSVTIDAARKRGELTEDQTSLRPRAIRHFKVPPRFSAEPRQQSGGQWQDTHGDAALSCTAAGYFFAMRLQEDLSVPVGLIDATWGGTPAEAWTSEEVVRSFKRHAGTLEQVKAAESQTADANAAAGAYWKAANERDPIAQTVGTLGFDDSGWQAVDVPSGYDALGLGNFDGVVWYRREIDVPAHWAGTALTLELPPIDDLDETSWNGTRVGSMMARGAWSKPRSYTVPADLVKAGPAVMTVRAYDTGGRGGFGTGTAKLSQGEEWIDLAGTWKAKAGPASSEMPQVPAARRRNQSTPSSLFNAMIAPNIPFKVQGVLWYQGESNRSYPDEYRSLFPAMIVDWRTRWERPELPFYFVQIAPYAYGGDGKWKRMAAELRGAQAAATALPRTGMVLTADIGNTRDIHPKNKWEVGRRLALFALRDVYGQADLEPDGPTLSRAVLDGSQVVLHFDHVAGRLNLIGETAGEFEVLGPNDEWHAAEATLSEDGQTVVLSCAAVQAPRGAQYLWTDVAEATVMGGAGLPMAPFKTTTLK